MMKKMLLAGIISIVFIVSLNQCTKIEYSNPIDIEGTNSKFLLENPGALLDTNNDSITDYFQNPLYNKDTTHPVITILGGDTVQILKDDSTHQLDNYLKTSSIRVTDAGGGPVNIREPDYNVNVFAVSATPYWIKYTAIDTSGNTTTATRYVLVVDAEIIDTKPPWLSLMDDTMYLNVGDTFIDPGVTAFDLTDGDLKSQVKTTGTVNTKVAGTYKITYSVSDKAGNKASIDRIVIVSKGGSDIDNVPPVITLNPPDTLYIPKGQTIETYNFVEPGYKASDNIDGDITAKVVRSERKYLSSEFYFYDYTVSDVAGNSATPRRRYINTGIKEGSNPPSIDLTLPDSIIQIVVGGTWKEPGYKAFDIDDGDITDRVIVNDTNVTNNLNKVGNYKVVYTVTNAKGITSQVTRNVTVTKSKFDTEPPVITLLGRNPDTTLAGGAAYKDPGATAWDEWDLDLTANISVSGTVNVKTLGKYTLTYRCQDKAGLTGTATRTVYVVRDTLTTDILVRYNVPTETPLPNMSNLTFATVDIDGDGPEAVKTAVKSHTINWSLTEKILRGFAFQYVAEPYYKEISSGVKQTFSEMQPDMTITGTQVTGLDGSYYVTYDAAKGEFIWVDTKGRFAIIWSK